MTSSMKASLDKLKSNHVEDQTETNDHFGELENDLNGLTVNLNESELILKNHTDQTVQLKTSIDKHNESEFILKNHTDQIDQLKTSMDKLEIEQNETKGIIEDLHPMEGTHLNCNFYQKRAK